MGGTEKLTACRVLGCAGWQQPSATTQPALIPACLAACPAALEIGVTETRIHTGCLALRCELTLLLPPLLLPSVLRFRLPCAAHVALDCLPHTIHSSTPLDSRAPTLHLHFLPTSAAYMAAELAGLSRARGGAGADIKVCLQDVRSSGSSSKKGRWTAQLKNNELDAQSEWAGQGRAVVWQTYPRSACTDSLPSWECSTGPLQIGHASTRTPAQHLRCAALRFQLPLLQAFSGGWQCGQATVWCWCGSQARQGAAATGHYLACWQ